MSPGYSGTPLPKKLGIKPNHRVALFNAPEDFRPGPLPDGAAFVDPDDGPLDIVVAFCADFAALEACFESLQRNLAQSGGLWVAWPKRASGVATDLTGDVVRTFGLRTGLVDNKVCAIDATWSGLRFVIRLADRTGRQASR